VVFCTGRINTYAGKTRKTNSFIWLMIINKKEERDIFRRQDECKAKTKNPAGAGFSYKESKII
jgi:hypothetical protein